MFWILRKEHGHRKLGLGLVARHRCSKIVIGGKYHHQLKVFDIDIDTHEDLVVRIIQLILIQLCR